MKPLKTNIYSIDSFRILILIIRYLVFRGIFGIRKIKDNEKASRINTVSHNFRVFKEKLPLFDFKTRRVELLINAALAHESVNTETNTLIIGPRTESDIFRLKGRGIKKIIGLDLITYSPLIKLGDMHEMPFDDNTFDLIVSGWTISYSNKPEEFFKEAVRCLRPGGILAMAFSHDEAVWDPTKPSKEREDKDLIHLNEERKLNSVADFKKYMDGTNTKFEITSNYDAYLKNMEREARREFNNFGSSIVICTAVILE